MGFWRLLHIGLYTACEASSCSGGNGVRHFIAFSKGFHPVGERGSSRHQLCFSASNLACAGGARGAWIDDAEEGLTTRSALPPTLSFRDARSAHPDLEIPDAQSTSGFARRRVRNDGKQSPPSTFKNPRAPSSYSELAEPAQVRTCAHVRRRGQMGDEIRKRRHVRRHAFQNKIESNHSIQHSRTKGGAHEFLERAKIRLRLARQVQGGEHGDVRIRAATDPRRPR